MEKTKYTITVTSEDMIYLGTMFLLAAQACREPNTLDKMNKLINKISAQYKEQKNGK